MVAYGYKPIIGRGSAIERIAASAEMQAHMAGVADAAAVVARQAARDPASIQTGVELRQGRWRAIVTNTHRQARYEEHGGRGWPAAHPLGRALDAVAAADPNRRSGRRLRGG